MKYTCREHGEMDAYLSLQVTSAGSEKIAHRFCLMCLAGLLLKSGVEQVTENAEENVTGKCARCGHDYPFCAGYHDVDKYYIDDALAESAEEKGC